MAASHLPKKPLLISAPGAVSAWTSSVRGSSYSMRCSRRIKGARWPWRKTAVASRTIARSAPPPARLVTTRAMFMQARKAMALCPLRSLGRRRLFINARQLAHHRLAAEFRSYAPSGRRRKRCAAAWIFDQGSERCGELGHVARRHLKGELAVLLDSFRHPAHVADDEGQARSHRFKHRN